MHVSNTALGMLTGWASLAQSQQFRAPGRQSYDVMGLSEACVEVLNTELQNCSPLLFSHTDRTTTTSVDVLSRETLDEICVPKCREELATLRVKIIDACTAPNDVMHHSGIEFPPFFFLDKFAYTYDINCYKDKSSDRFCDELRSDWRNYVVKFDQCHGCYLGPLAAMISSPVGVSKDLVDRFKEVKASCGDTEYVPEIAKSYAKFTSSSIKTASLGKLNDPRKCARYYSMQEGDTCASISKSQRTPTINLIQKNMLDVDCVTMPEVGTELCLDEAVDTHTIAAGETCASIAEQYKITEIQLRAVNEIFDEKCSNIARWEGYVVCVGPRSLFSGSVEAGRFPQFSSSQAKTAKPITPQKPLAPRSSTKCNMFVNARSLTDPDLIATWGDVDDYMTEATISRLNKCNVVTHYNGITFARLLELNPILSNWDCKLDERYSYCLAEEGGERPNLEPGWNRQWGLRWG